MSFPEDSYAFGVPMSGKTKKDLYIFVFACTVGMFFATITGFPTSSPVFSAFLKDELGVSNTLYGVFVALPYFAALLQIPFAAYLRKKPRVKEFYILFSLVTRLNFVVIGVVSYFLSGVNRSLLIALVLAIQSVTSVFWWITDLCFSLWSGHTCPASCNGRFFSTRQMSFTAAQIFYSFLLTILLNFLDNKPEKYLVIFTLAGIFGCVEILSFIFVRPPAIAPLAETVGETARASSPLAPFKHKSYRNFLVFSTLWYFGNFLQGPFTNVFMNDHLRVPVSRQTFYCALLPGFATVFFIRLFGRMSDRYGYRNCLLLFSTLAAATSASWFFVTPPTEGLIGIANFGWGIVGTATDLAIFSMGIYLAPIEERTTFLSVKTVLMNLVGIAPSILLGGIIMDHLKPVLEKASIPFIMGQTVLPFHVITFLAIAIRFFAVFVFARRLEPDNDLNFRQFLTKFGNVTRFRIRLRAGLLNKRGK